MDKADYSAPTMAASPTADEAVGTIAPGGTVTAVIDTGGDVDYFNISLVAGQTYTISMAGSGGAALIDPYLSLTHLGVAVANDDDGGQGINSLFTFTATVTGTYQIVAEAYPGSGLTGGYTIDVRQMGSDAVGPNIATATAITANSTTFGFLETGSDVDMYAVTLVAGEYYTFELAGGADYNTDYNAVPAGEIDTLITLYDANGNQVAFNDDLAFPDDISSGVGFSPTVSGTYYVKVDGYSGQTGGYTLDVEQVDLSGLDPLDTIDWGTQLASNTVTVYFAPLGETYDGVTSLGWSQYEIDQAMAAFQTYADVANLTFTITANASTATFKLVTTTSTEYLGYFNPPGTTNAGVGVFATNGTGWDETGGLEAGGYGYITLVHEFGHGLGLSHPHDNGGTSSVMPGVSSPFGSYGVYDLNQGVYTTMSYNDGWQLHPDGADPGSFNYGYQTGPSALDIAVVQAKYGATSFNTGDNVYVLPTANAAGTFWDVIWDTGGNDTIAHNGTVSATIDLTAATLDYSATGGGVISFVDGIFGGFTIAAGVVIENASGGSGADVLIGNSAANVLTGNAGDDTLQGNGGIDRFIFDLGDGQDTITDLVAGETVEITGYLAAQSVTQSGADVIVELSNTDRITFLNATVATVQGALLFPDAAQGPTEGNDVLDGTAGNDVIDALGGNDTVNGLAGDDVIDGGAGNDILDGGTGVDTATYQSAASRVTVSLQVAGAQATGGSGSDTLANFENLTGSAFADTLGGNGLSNVLTGLAGNDTLNGRGGADTAIGGAGNDTYIVDNAGDLVVELAGEGTDRVKALASHVLADNVENLILMGSAAIDGTGNSLNNQIYGNSAANVLSGGGGNDKLIGGGGDDTMIGGLGDDIYIVTSGGDLVVELAGEGIDQANSSVSYTLTDNVERLQLSGGAAIDGTGNSLANELTGNSGANILSGLDGDDRIYGNGGNDVIDGGAGGDLMYGGAGDDIFHVDHADDFALENAGEGIDTVHASVSHRLRSNVENIVLTGTDSITSRGNELGNSMTGNSGVNELFGLAGDDFLYGNQGNDALEGGTGTDTMAGGTGADTFVFRNGDFGGLTQATADKVTDFSQAEGDTLRLDFVDADTLSAGDQAFTFIGTGAFTNVAGQLRSETVSGNTFVYGDTNGDGAADFMIFVSGAHTLASGDFVL